MKHIATHESGKFCGFRFHSCLCRCRTGMVIVMKTQKEPNALKEEIEAPDKKLRDLNDKELTPVTGGGKTSDDSISDELVKACMYILHQMQLYPTEKSVRFLIAKGGSALRNWALDKSGGNKTAYTIPEF